MTRSGARAILLLAASLATACATSSAFQAGRQAEKRREYDRAALEYSRALQEDPDNSMYRQSLERARIRGAEAHAQTARSLVAGGQLEKAMPEFRLAQALDPSSPRLRQEIQELEAKLQAPKPEPTLQEAKRRARERPLGLLAPGPGAREPMSLSFPNTSLREAYQALARVAGISVVFDPAFQDQNVSLDLRDLPFEQALSALAAAGRTFHRIVEPTVLAVIPDTPTKRREYEQQLIKTIYLSSADLKETIDLLRIVLGARRVAALPGANALTINDAPDRVAAAERIVAMIDKRRAEVIVDVEILEVDRTKLKDYGIEITSAPGGVGIVGGIFPNPSGTTTLDQNPYRSSNLVATGLPGVIYRLLQQDGTTRVLANPQLRTTEGQTAQARFGDRFPVPVTTFAPIATGGISQQAITSFEYKDVGVNIDITPRVHHEGDVSLTLKLEISALGQPGYQNLPTFTSRTVTTVLRLGEGETNILAGLIRDEERQSMTGIPGLASIPFLGRLFARNKIEVAETDIVMTLTPRVVRRPELTEDDLRSFAIGGDASSVVFDLPAPVAPASPQRPQDSPKPEPIRPPTPPATSPPPSPQG
jgi:general secretion pathway protein D